MFSKRPEKPKLGIPIEVKQQVGGAELCRFTLETAVTTKDSSKLHDILGSTLEHYEEYEEGKPRSTKYQFVDPKRILKGSIRSFREKG